MMQISRSAKALSLLFVVLSAVALASQELDLTGHTNTPVTAGLPSPVQSGVGNPLWAIPLSSLNATRTRPIFSSTRRPPPGSSFQLQQAGGPVRPPLSLVGAILMENGGVAILLDETSKGIVRLQVGESHQGWTLESVQRREVTLKRDRQSTILQLSTVK
jgi:general secretion pathway protein N